MYSVRETSPCSQISRASGRCMSSSDEDAGDSLFGDFFVNKSYANAALTFGEDGPAQRTLRLRLNVAQPG